MLTPIYSDVLSVVKGMPNMYIYIYIWPNYNIPPDFPEISGLSFLSNLLPFEVAEVL